MWYNVGVKYPPWLYGESKVVKCEMKYQYTYKVYRGYPEATEISRDREEKKPLSFGLAVFTIIVGIIALIADFSASWYISLLIIAFGCFGIFYNIKYYDATTERKINRAIKKRDEMNKNGRGVL